MPTRLDSKSSGLTSQALWRRDLLEHFHLLSAPDRRKVASLVQEFRIATEKAEEEIGETGKWGPLARVDDEYDRKFTTLRDEITCQQE